AEDGIRDFHVTGVQTCALPIFILTGRKVPAEECLNIGLCEYLTPKGGARKKAEALAQEIARFPQVCVRADRRSALRSHGLTVRRSEERRVGKECRARVSPEQYK